MGFAVQGERYGHVCLVCNDVLVRAVLLAGLRAAGFSALTASGRTILELVEQRPPAAIVAGPYLAGIGCVPWIGEVRRRAPELPIVAIGERTQTAGGDLARWLGVHACLIKPFDMAELTALLAGLLAERDERKW